MKSFFEEYGFVILAAIVVIILIAMATPIGDLVKIQVSEVVNSFGSKTQSKLNATDGIIQVRVSTTNNKITLEWDANKKEDVFKYQYKASTTSKDADWTPITEVSTGSDKSRKVEITKDSNDQPLTNKTKVEYKIYDSNDQLVASGIVTAKVGKNATTGGEAGVDGGTTENPTTPTETLETGKKIEIEGKEYIVIERVINNQYKLMAADLFTGNFKPEQNFSSDYLTCPIATYLDNNYYNQLPENIKKAIVETSIQQKVSSTAEDGGKNSPTWTDEVKEAGTHKVFLPSWDEVIKAAKGTDVETLKNFLNFSSSVGFWLRDLFKTDTNEYCLLGLFWSGNLISQKDFDPTPFGKYGNTYPAFVIDLSKVEYTVK